MSSGYLKIYLVLTVLAILVNWPGRVNPDTVDMLWQAQNPALMTDWHSPFITFSYGILWPVFGYPGGALVIQSALLMLWPALVLHRLLVSQSCLLVNLLFLVVWLAISMVFIALAGQVVKDVFVVGIFSAIFCFIGFRGSIYDADAGGMPGWILILSLVLVLSRVTNFVVVLSCGAAIVSFILFNSQWKRQYGVCMMVMIVLMVFFMVNAGSMFGASKSHPERSPIIFDLAGISYYSGVNQFNLDSGAKFIKSPAECYTPKQSDPFIWGVCSEYDSYLRSKNDIVKNWAFAIVSHPVEYFRHRIKFAVELLTKDGGANEILVANPPFDAASNAEKYNVILPENRVPKMDAWRPTVGFIPFGMASFYILSSPIGHPLFWCATLIANLVFILRSKANVVPLLLSVAGISNVIAFILLSGSDDLRYLLPTFFCALAVMVYWAGKIMFRFENLRSGCKAKLFQKYVFFLG